MSNENEWSAPDSQAGQGGGPDSQVGQGGGADQPAHGQAQDGWGQPMPPPPPVWGGQQPQVAKPGVIPLRPLGLGEILDGAISTIRAYPKLTLGVSAIVAVINQAIALVVAWAFFHNNDSSTTYDFVTQAISFLAYTFASGILTVVVARAVLGQPVSFGEVWAALRPKLLPLLGLTFLYSLIVSVGLVLLLIPGIWLGVRYLLATPALILEPVSVGRAFGRSRQLVRRSWWRMFGIMLLTLVIAMIIGMIIAFPFGLLIGASNPDLVPSLGSLVLLAIGAVIASTILDPFVSAVQVLLYVDQRMRREGLDIELARAAGLPVPPGYPGGRP